jgi:hypothetical protein
MTAPKPKPPGKSEALAAQIAQLKKLDGLQTEAGWFETARYQAGPKVNPKMVGMPVATIARFNEFGTKRAPARPFMRLAYKDFLASKGALQKKVARQMMTKGVDAEKAMKQIGLFMEGCIVNAIKNGGWVPNAPSTVAKKGFDTPLIDTAQMWQSVASKVSKSQST